MDEQNFFDRINEENRFPRFIDLITLFKHFLFAVPCWFIFFWYMNRIPLSKVSVTSFLALFIFAEIIIVAKKLNRERIHLESKIKQDIELKLKGIDLRMPSWKDYKYQFKTIQAISLILPALPIAAALVFPASILRYHFKVIFLFAFILAICIKGILRLVMFRNYMNALIRIYQSITRLFGRQVNNVSFINYNFRTIFIYPIIAGFFLFLAFHGLLLRETQILNNIFLSLIFCVLFIFGKGLHLAIKGFRESISQIKILRKEIIK